MPTLLIGADICPIEGNRRYFQSGDAGSLFHDLLPEMEAADLVMANLECPFIEAPSPILKTGPTFGEPGDCINGIRAGGIDVLCLANNHILDHGPAGLRHTLEVCRRAGIDTVGAGENLEAASRMLVRDVDSVRIGIVVMAEQEFSIATRTSSGANPLDIMGFVRQMRRDRSRFDHLIVLLHGSAEFHVPTPRIQEICRFFIEEGAGAVIVQHPHVLGGTETYQGGHIVYGQGAWIMDEAIYRDRASFHEGFLVKLEIEDAGQMTMQLIPFVQSNPVPGARRMEPRQEAALRERLAARSAALVDPAFVEGEWRRFCEENRHGYVSALLGHNRVLRKLNAHGGWVTRLLHGRRPLLSARNIVCCETHREAIETILKEGMAL